MVAQYELNNKVHNWLSKEKEMSFNCSILYNNSLYCSFFQHPHNFSRGLCKGAGLLDLQLIQRCKIKGTLASFLFLLYNSLLPVDLFFNESLFSYLMGRLVSVLMLEFITCLQRSFLIKNLYIHLAKLRALNHKPCFKVLRPGFTTVKCNFTATKVHQKMFCTL